MSLISERFAALSATPRCGFIPFLVAGDPDLKATAELLRALSTLQPIAIEVGVPFSDPTADGPIIQRAAQRALSKGTSLVQILRMLDGLRRDELAPLVLFSYYNPILQLGLEEFARMTADSGVAGVLVVDLTAEDAAPLRERLRARGVDLILLVAPTTSDQRLKQIAGLASGFIYAISRTGVTGTARQLLDESRQLVARIRGITDLPIAVGFGITRPEGMARVCRYADAAVVGSRLVAEIERATAKPGFRRAEVVRRVLACARRFVK